MPPAKIPGNEADRDRTMRQFCLRGEPDPCAQSFAAVAAELAGCPTALVSIVQDDRQWFMGATGLDVFETPRDYAFCAHAILASEPLVVPDAREDPRFLDNPLVTGDLGIRFYAGFPLRTSDDVAVGTLCVIDYEPRELDGSTRAAMEHLRDLTVRFLRSRGEAIVHRSASEAKSSFLANIGHEIRTPLTAVLGYAEIISEQTGIPGFDPRETAQTIRRHGRHLLDLINDMLEMAKLEAGRVEPEIIDCAPAEVFGDCIELLEREAQRKQIFLELSIDDGVPDVISSDPTRLRQAALNLLSNAIKFTEEGGVTVRLSFEPDGAGGGTLSVTVTDTGTGISPDALDRLRQFRAFSQADISTTRQHGGSGLGLSIVHSIATVLGGGLRIESQPGVGTTAVFSFTAGPAVRSTMPATSAAQQPCSDRLEGLSVLVAEDGPDNQRLIRYHLERAGCLVRIVENGEELVEAVESAARHGKLPDLILADLHMPILDGIGAVRRIRSLGVDIPIAVLTADSGDAIWRECRDAGFNEYIAKPFTKVTLLRGCEAATGSARRAA